MIKVPHFGPLDSDLMLVGEAPGGSEEMSPSLGPFTGSAGDELDKILVEVGLNRAELRLANVCNYRPPNNDIGSFFYNKTQAKKKHLTQLNGRFPNKYVLEGIVELYDEIDEVRPKMIVALGNTSLWALTGNWGIMSWRGSMLEIEREWGTVMIVPTVHPAAILRVWAWRVLVVADLRRAVKAYRSGAFSRREGVFILRPSFVQVMDVINTLRARMDDGEKIKLSIDIETRHRHITCIGFAWSITEAICIPITSTSNPAGYWRPIEEKAIVMNLHILFTNPNAYCGGQNFMNYDTQYLIRWWGLDVPIQWDTIIKQHVCYPGEKKSLDYMASLYCEDYTFWKQEGRQWNPDLHTEEQYWAYNCKDCIYTYECDEVLDTIVDFFKLEKVLEFQMSQIRPVLFMMLRGVKVDTEKRNELAQELLEYMMELEAWFEAVVPPSYYPRKKGASPWYRSPKQIGEIIYDCWHLPEQKDRKTKKRTTKAEALERLVGNEPIFGVVLKNLIEYASLGSLMTNFIQAPLDWDGRYRSSMSIVGTETYRYSSSKDVFGFGGNMQNITSGEE